MSMYNEFGMTPIKHPKDRGFIDHDLGWCIECDEVPNMSYNSILPIFKIIYPHYNLDGFKCHDAKLPEGRVFLFYSKKEKSKQQRLP
jgi:hypothetical protein